MIYDIDYFIQKFEAIPEDEWTWGTYENEGKCCALGHCGVRTGSQNRPYVAVGIDSDEVKGLLSVLKTTRAGAIVDINDGFNDNYKQETPKQRILAALRDQK